MKYDYYENNFDWLAAVLWCLLICLFVWDGINEYRISKLQKRLDEIEMYQGPATPTEWTIVNGKMTLYQSPYYVQVVP